MSICMAFVRKKTKYISDSVQEFSSGEQTLLVFSADHIKKAEKKQFNDLPRLVIVEFSVKVKMQFDLLNKRCIVRKLLQRQRHQQKTKANMWADHKIEVDLNKCNNGARDVINPASSNPIYTTQTKYFHFHGKYEFFHVCCLFLNIY